MGGEPIPRLKWLYVLAILLCTPIVSFAQEHDKENAETPTYDVHEWGVFTVPRGADWLKQDMLNEWKTFPDFFQGTLPNRDLVYRGPVTKPVLFFHTQDQFAIELYIQFADGQPLIWWPCAEYPATGSFGPIVPRDVKLIHEDALLRFYLSVNSGSGNREQVADNHWVNALRKVDAATVSTDRSYSNLRAPGESKVTEDFVYYDGLMKPPKAPTLKRTPDGTQLTTDSDHDWFDVLIIERAYDGATLKTHFIDKIEKGNQTTICKWNNLQNENINDVKLEFKKRLTTTGLNDDEIDSLITVWGPGLFERPGISVVYRIPQDIYDQWIPVALIPKPEKFVRVGLVVHQNLEPELDQNVNQLIRQLGSTRFKDRENAEKILQKIGGAAIEPIKNAARSSDPEVADRANRLLQQLDVDQLLKKVMKRYQQPQSENKPGN